MIDESKFIELNPYLYHLTDERNYNTIIKQKRLMSTVELVSLSTLDNSKEFLKSRRSSHTCIEIDNEKIYIRDQRPLNRALDKCLTHNWTASDFIVHLNKRVFTWPNLYRLGQHFKRYKDEKPIIFRFGTEDLLSINHHVEISHLNTGTTRPSYHLGGVASPRGPETFVPFSEFKRTIREVAEVTFPGYCLLPPVFETGYDPNGPWQPKNLDILS